MRPKSFEDFLLMYNLPSSSLLVSLPGMVASPRLQVKKSWPKTRQSLRQEGRFEGEALAPLRMVENLLQHQTPGSKSRSFRLERGQPGGNEIGVDKGGTARLLRQELLGKGGFPRAVWSGNDDDFLLWLADHS